MRSEITRSPQTGVAINALKQARMEELGTSALAMGWVALEAPGPTFRAMPEMLASGP